jgi:mRNA-degrading endonuclease RelE of RelBE toxin-antitoxin system
MFADVKRSIVLLPMTLVERRKYAFFTEMTSITLVDRVSAGRAEAISGHVSYRTASGLAQDLEGLWNPDIAPSPSVAPLAHPDFRRYAPPSPKRPPPWFIGMTSGFSKDINKIDRKLQGRILEALNEITQNPVSLRGDTVKPLSGELEGCWRYRIGDYRLIYSPDKSTGDITLLAFESRGSVYSD